MDSQNDCWWYLGEEDYLIIWTTDLNTKFKFEPMGVYYNPKGKMFARQFLIKEDSIEHSILFKELKLTNKHRLNEIRKPISRGGKKNVI